MSDLWLSPSWLLSSLHVTKYLDVLDTIGEPDYLALLLVNREQLTMEDVGGARELLGTTEIGEMICHLSASRRNSASLI